MSTTDLSPEFLNKGMFRNFPPEERAALLSEFSRVAINRGDVLMRQGDVADAMYFVVSGRFEVRLDGREAPVAEIGAGSPIGEIAFLAGGERSATVVAARDSLVLRLGRAEFDHLCESVPRIWHSFATTLASRIIAVDAALNQGGGPTERPPRVITIIPAGPAPIPPPFVDMLTAELGRHGRTLTVRSADIPALIGAAVEIGSQRMTERLNTLEEQYQIIVNVADDQFTPWSEKAISQSDLLLRVGATQPATQSPVPPNAQERYADSLLAPKSQRLVLLHHQRLSPSGSRHWLAGRDVRMHHHVALSDMEDVQRLVRFIRGEAIGLVACGGGALCAAHIGLYKAMTECGLSFDIMGGTSGGSAMTAAFAMGLEPDEIDNLTDDIFVKNRALRRYTWPRYSLLDHTHFDRQIAKHYAGIDIEDLWIPFYAVSTNLSRYAPHLHRTGDLWQAVRASSSIPGLLPPFYTEDGQMLVDGCLLDNVPVSPMHELKSGPNVVVAFKVPHLDRFAVDYSALPSRMEMFTRMLRPFRRPPLPSAPSLGSVLLRSLLVNSQNFERHLRPEDLLLVPPLPPNITIMDWNRHADLMQDAYHWGMDNLGGFAAAEPPALAHLHPGHKVPYARVRR